MSVNEAAVAVERLRVGYDYGVEILRGIDFIAAQGKITAVIGPNGAGKSTLLRAIFGLARIMDGTVRIDGTIATGLPPRRLLELGVVYVPQERTTFAELSVRENLQMGAWASNRPRAWIADRVAAVIDEFPILAAVADRPAGDLSGGQQKILEIARGLILDPSVLLLDEPTASLAPQPALQVYEEIAALSRNRGKTVILVDQNVREALAIADWAYALAIGMNHTNGRASDVESRLGTIVADWFEDLTPVPSRS